ncbi:hypothetical protein KKB55_15435 [Myxococcota bacterium]|nr:hypothetical protein [Myxococcota bacterium]
MLTGGQGALRQGERAAGAEQAGGLGVAGVLTGARFCQIEGERAEADLRRRVAEVQQARALDL